MSNKFNLVKLLLKMGLVSLFIATVFSGCVSSGKINSYVEPTYNNGNIRSIAMFPIRNAKFAPSEARQLNKQLIQEMAKKNHNVKIISPSKALRLIDDSGLASDWADFVEDYYTSGIADKKALSKFSKTLGVDAIFQGQLLNVTQIDGHFGRYGKTKITMSLSIVEIKTAKVIWEATADGTKFTSTDFGETAPPISEAIDLAMAKVKENIPFL